MAEVSKIEHIDIEKLIPYINNAKIHSDDQVTKIAASIREFGFVNPVLIDKDYNIIAGHGRTMAAKKLELDKVPCLFVEGLTEAQRKAYILADNRLGELADWDMELVNSELEQLMEMNFDIDLTGFDKSNESDNDDAEAEDDEYIEEIPENPKAKQGDVYLLGEHVLMCGDSTNPDDVKKLMGEIKADLVVTDPPYNVAIKNSKGMTIENDNIGNEEFKLFLNKCFKNLESSLKEGGSFYVWYASREHINFETALNEANLIVRQQLIWNKNTFILGRSDYHWKHEPCLYGWKDGAAHYFIDDRTQSTVFEDPKQDIKKMKKEELVEILEKLMSDRESTTVIDVEKPSINDMHPTMKPIKLIAKQIKNSSKINETVLDLFGGSGSTLIACEQIKRKARIMEYDPKYVDVIIDRWEKFTGKKAVLLDGQS